MVYPTKVKVRSSLADYHQAFLYERLVEPMQSKHPYFLFLLPLFFVGQKAVVLPFDFRVGNYDRPPLSYMVGQGFLFWPIWGVALLIILIAMLAFSSVFLLSKFRKQNEALGISEAKYREMLNNSLVGILIIQNQVIQYCDQGLADLYGFSSPDDLISLSVKDLVAPGSWSNFKTEIELLESGEKKISHYQFKGLRGDGSIFNLETLGNVIEYQGKPAVQIVFKNITERMLTEQAMHDNEKRYRMLFERSLAPIYLSTFNGQILDANNAFIDLLGHETLADLKAQSTTDLYFDLSDQDKFLSLLKENGTLKNIENCLRNKNGAPVWVLEDVSIIDDQDIEPYILGTAIDITARKKAEAALKESETRYRNLFQEIPIGVYRSTPDGQILDVNPAFVQMLGYPDKEKLLSVNAADLFKTPEDRNFELAELEKTDIVNKFEMRIRQYDGNLIWVQDTFRVVRDAEGRILHYEGSLEDITERVQSELSLRENEAFLQQAQKVAQLGSYELDITTGKWISSEILKGIFGIDEGFQLDVDGWVSILHPDNREMMQNYFADDVLAQHHRFDKEYRIIRAVDKEERWVHGLGGLEFDHQGNPISMVGTIQDITERVQAEEELKQNTLRLETLRKASLSLTAHLSLPAVLDALLEYVLQLVPADDAHIFTYDGTALHFGAVRWADGRQEEPFSEPRKDGLTYTVARSGETLVVNDMSQSPIFQNWPLEGAIVGLPLLHGKQVVGVMNVATEIARKFSKSELRILELLADQAAVAINNARLYEEVQQHAQKLEVINKISTALSTSLDLDTVLKLFLEQIKAVLPMDSGAIFLSEKDGFRVMVDHGISPSIKGRVFPDDNELFNEIKKTQAPIILKNTKEDSRFENWGLFENITSWMGIPLIARDTLIGFLTLDSFHFNDYLPEQAELAFIFATQAAQAIENARLHEHVIQDANEMEKRIQKRTTELQKFVDLTAGREIRMVELKRVIQKLRTQLEEVGQTPVANDPLIQALENDE